MQKINNIYFTFKDVLAKPIPQLAISDTLFPTVNLVTVLALLLATPSITHKKRAKKILLAIGITFLVHILSMLMDIMSAKWSSVYTISLFNLRSSQLL